ncbi:MAG TPA: helical backbone metal receptor, partial [Vicinamibacterales bacterium]|nr:helical backbone metal receptor [Vicinamibacterales bacterium]
AIGAGPAVVGASSFDVLPPGVTGVARVGGLLDPDTERILALRPDLTIVYATQRDLIDRLRRAGLNVRPYRHGGLSEAIAEIRALGALVGRAREAEVLAAEIERRLSAVRRAVAGRPRPRVLVVFGRERGTLRTIYASGGRGFIHDLVETAGGRNVFADVPRENLQATTELVLAAAPEVILELRAEPLAPDDAERERRVWSALAAVPAVRAGRIHSLAGRELVVPGPRLAEAAERFAAVLHPEAGTKNTEGTKDTKDAEDGRDAKGAHAAKDKARAGARTPAPATRRER